MSVVVPAYNSAPFLAACLDSLLRQSKAPLEIIVVDDASTDETAKIASRFQVRTFSLPRNTGAGYARSYGATKSTGDVIAFLDSDCVAPTDWIETLLDAFASDPMLGAVGGRYTHTRQTSLTSLMAGLEEQYAHFEFSLSPLESNPPAGNSAFLRDVWFNARSGHEIYLFRGINSGEDEFAFNEVRKSARVKYLHDLKVGHLARDTGGYFRRHVNRGRSFGLRIVRNMLGDAKGGIRAYGGMELLFASAMIPLAALSLALAPLYIPAAGVSAIAIGAFLLLSRRFARFVSNTNAQLSPADRISTRERCGLYLLLPARTACWVLGTLIYISYALRLFAKRTWNVAMSVAHFWIPGKVSKLFFFVTSACNARCEFCFNLENVENWKARKRTELTLEEIQRVASGFRRLPYLNLSGGEPFMRPDLADVIEAFHTRCRTQWVTIPTNASLTKIVLETTQEILTRCPSLFLTIQISLDGLNESHDRSRKIEGGFAAMLVTLKQLSALRKWHPNLRVQIATAYDDFNLSQMEEMIKLCRGSFDYDQQIFYLIREDGNLITQSKNHLIESFMETVNKNEDYEWSKHRRTLWSRAVRTLQGVTYTDVMRIRREKVFLRHCHAIKKFVTLYDDGQVSPCEVLESVKLGNVRDFGYDYYELARRTAALDFYDNEIIKNKCNCDWMCATPINMLYDPRIIPRVAKALANPSKAS